MDLFDLPAELRNNIYECVLTSDKPITFKRNTCCHINSIVCLATTTGKCGYLDSKKHLTVALLRINRQIMEEATAALYGKNTFVFDTKADELEWREERGEDKAKFLKKDNVKVRKAKKE